MSPRYQPPFTLTTKIVSQVATVAERIGRLGDTTDPVADPVSDPVDQLSRARIRPAGAVNAAVPPGPAAAPHLPQHGIAPAPFESYASTGSARPGLGRFDFGGAGSQHARNWDFKIANRLKFRMSLI